ncbi:MAG: T9SS type A sorting domain-containing protein, partial [Candidatus Zixiibacteriota bacterium]
KITVSDPGIDHVAIYDITGRLVERLELNGGEVIWHATKYKSGVYFARVDDRKSPNNIKIVLLK